MGYTMDIKEVYKAKHVINKLCRSIGAYQMNHLGRPDLLIDSKTTAVDLVTEVDKASEKKIIDRINWQWPDHSILAEESGETDKDSDYVWIIDPVDGTTNYAHGFPLFAIAVALTYKGDTLLGCIYLPALDEFYWSIKGEGAYVNEKQIHVSESCTLEQSVISTGFPYNKKTSPHNNLDYFTHIVPRVGGIRRSGSACVDLVSVAAGRMDGYFEMNLNPWDYVAGQLIVREAGGTCEAREVRGKYSVVTGNKTVYELLKNELNKVGTEDY